MKTFVKPRWRLWSESPANASAAKVLATITRADVTVSPVWRIARNLCFVQRQRTRLLAYSRFDQRLSAPGRSGTWT